MSRKKTSTTIINNQFHSLIESTSDAIVFSDQLGNITLWNNGAKKIFGYQTNEIIGKPISKIIQKGFYKQHRNGIHRFLITNKQKHICKTIESEGLKKDGSPFPVEIALSTWGEKQEIFFGAIIRDISIRKQAEKALHESEKKFRMLIEQSYNAIYLLYKDKFEIINSRFFKLFGYTLEECQDKNFNFRQLVAPKSLQLLENRIKRKQRGEQLEPVYEFTAINKNGMEIECEVSISYIDYKDGTAVQGIIRDITKRFKIEKEKQNLQEQLIQAQKMEAIGTLAGGIAHDFNNLLGVIMGYTELTINNTSIPENIKKNLHHVMKASERAREMVKQILTFSRKSNENMEPINIGKIIEETTTFLRSAIPSTIEIISIIEDDLGLIFGNATQINQILMNLSTNGAHAMKEKGGVLKIILKEFILDKGRSKTFDLDPGRYLQLIISDTGSGMNKELINHIFEPFFTTKKSGEGTGLGLSVVYGIVKNHNGKIKIDSEPGKGTTFNVYLPVIEHINIEETDADRVYAPIGNNEMVLFVDDEISISELATQMLKSLGYLVESRTSSIEALEAFKADPDKFDLIITDMTMPNMTGIKLASEIRKIKPAIPIILCTGFSSTVNKNNFRDYGIDELIMKPVIQIELGNIIHKVLNKKGGVCNDENIDNR